MVTEVAKAGRSVPAKETPDTKKFGKSPLNMAALAAAVIAFGFVGYWVVAGDSVRGAKRDPAEAQNQVRLNATLRSAGAGDWVKADAETKEMMRSAPVPPQGDRKLAQAQNAEGIKALRSKDYALAIKFFGKAVGAEPGNVYWIDNLGYAYLRNNEIPEAERHFERALSFVPNHGVTWQNLAEAYAEHNNASAAKAALKLAIRHSTNRRKTMDLLSKDKSGASKAKFGLIIAEVLTDVSSIPATPLK